ncbi:MAG: Heimdall-CTERM domain-containing surface protein, partial [Candidatus Hodarchaeota archaeon]
SINLTKLETPIELGFWSWAETENIPDVDRKEILVSVDGGSWDLLGQVPDSDYMWQYYGFDLSPYAYSEDVRIRFSFDTDDEYANYYRGWMLDDITIGFPHPRFELFIMQDFDAVVGETRPIDFHAKSFYETYQTTNISIFIETPSGTEILLEEFFYTIDPYGTWNHNEQYMFTEPGLYTVNFVLTDFDTGTEWNVDCYWEVEDQRFELSIIQDSTAYVEQEKCMNFYLDSYFSSDQYVDIKIVITPPMGYNETLFEEYSIYIGAYETWDISLCYKFQMEGTYNVNFIVIDAYDVKWDIYCPWYIVGEGFSLWIEQEYYAGITDNRKMGFFIDSFFDISVQVNVTIKMETPTGVNETLFFESYMWIDSYSLWEVWLDYTFTQTGEYWVYFIVEDEFGVEWVYMCWWEVEADFFDMWIDQEMYAGVTDYREMKFHAKSYFQHGTLVNISIDIMTPSGSIENLFSEDWVTIEGFGFWEYSLEYSFLDAGEYLVLFSIVDEYGAGWARECSWYIGEDFIGVWIEQDMDAIVGETRTMDFNAKNYFDSGMYISVFIEIDTPFGTETLMEDTSWIDAYSTLFYSIDYTFTEPGEYKVFFRVIDDYSNEYTIDCYWKVHEKGGFDLKIDQDYEAEVGDEKRMKFLVKSNFDHDMEVEIMITIKTPSGAEETLLHEMVWIYSYDPWEESIYYEFKEVGTYKVLFVLIDDIGVEWTADCEWDISEPTTETTGSEESGSPTIPGSITPGFESYLILGAIAAIAIYYRKRHV